MLRDSQADVFAGRSPVKGVVSERIGSGKLGLGGGMRMLGKASPPHEVGEVAIDWRVAPMWV